jgi:hypothetical protein
MPGSVVGDDNLPKFKASRMRKAAMTRKQTALGRIGMSGRRGVTFLELMLSITIVMAACSIVFPVVNAGRKAMDVDECLGNLREILAAATFYAKDNDSAGSGSRPTQPWYVDAPDLNFAYFSEFVYGGFQTQVDHPYFPNSDTFRIPTERRPFNKYVAPGRIGRQPLKQYICPSDKAAVTPLVGGGGTPPMSDQRYSSWEVNGNSYTINWYWENGNFGPSGAHYSPLYDDKNTPRFECNMNDEGVAMLQKKAGGAASEFILFMEGIMNAYMYDARPPGYEPPSELQMLQVGWHGKLSRYTMGFYDGHADYRYIDTRYSNGPGYDIWPEADTEWPICSD